MSTLFRDKKAGAGKDILVKDTRMEYQLGTRKGPAFRDMPRKGEDRLLLGNPGLLGEMRMLITSIPRGCGGTLPLQNKPSEELRALAINRKKDGELGQ